MSVKSKIRNLRRPGGNGDKPKAIRATQILTFEDGRIEVMGLPKNYHQAMELMAGATRRTANFFLALATEGKLDEKMNIKEGNIITKDPAIDALKMKWK